MGPSTGRWIATTTTGYTETSVGGSRRGEDNPDGERGTAPGSAKEPAHRHDREPIAARPCPGPRSQDPRRRRRDRGGAGAAAGPLRGAGRRRLLPHGPAAISRLPRDRPPDLHPG